MKAIQVPTASAAKTQAPPMTTEAYLNHPTFGLLFRVCFLDNGQELFATLYAQRLFFLVTVANQGIQFDPVGRADARLSVENRLRALRRYGQSEELNQLQLTYRQTFHQFLV